MKEKFKIQRSTLKSILKVANCSSDDPTRSKLSVVNLCAGEKESSEVLVQATNGWILSRRIISDNEFYNTLAAKEDGLNIDRHYISSLKTFLSNNIGMPCFIAVLGEDFLCVETKVEKCFLPLKQIEKIDFERVIKCALDQEEYAEISVNRRLLSKVSKAVSSDPDNNSVTLNIHKTDPLKMLVVKDASLGGRDIGLIMPLKLEHHS